MKWSPASSYDAAVPWTVRYAMARAEAGLPNAPWLAMCVQMWRNGSHGYW